MFIDCKKSSLLELYKVLSGSIIPRPIAWVSTRHANGLYNLAPFSFFNLFGVDPPTIAFAPGYKNMINNGVGANPEPKDTLRNIIDTNEFVVNLVSRELAGKMNQTSGEYLHGTSEFDEVGLTAVSSKFVSAPQVAESPVSMEYNLVQIVRHGNNNIVIGEIVGINVEDSVIDERGHINGNALQAIGRMAGDWYTTTVDGNFEIARPIISR
jgi:flavin reductase (DIM6/NTAB) family NADH-FMN oxidoreductase RutF